MTHKNSDRAALDRLTVALVEDLLNASDEDILAEAQQDHDDVDAVAAATRAQFEQAAVRAAKERLSAAKAAVANERGAPASVSQLDAAEARRRLERIFARDPNLTLAARKGSQDLSDEDVRGMLEDLYDLGFDTDPVEPK